MSSEGNQPYKEACATARNTAPRNTAVEDLKGDMEVPPKGARRKQSAKLFWVTGLVRSVLNKLTPRSDGVKSHIPWCLSPYLAFPETDRGLGLHYFSVIWFFGRLQLNRV